MSTSTEAVVRATAPRGLKDHDLAPLPEGGGVRFEKRPARDGAGRPVPGLFNAWITLDNEAQYNSYTTEMVKAVILAFRAASNARDIVAVVFTGAGDKAFCTGGNTKGYAADFPGDPPGYPRYMRLFHNM